MSGDAKRFRALHGSAGRHGEAFWTEEKDNVGLKLLKGMGWSQGQGLGKDGQGRVDIVKQRKRKDNAGIGASAATRDEAFRASQDLFNDVLSRLSSGVSGAPAADTEPSGPGALGSAATSITGALARRQMTRRFCRASSTGGLSSNVNMDEILGRKTVGSGKDGKAGAPADDAPAAREDLNQTASSVSVSDYFARRRKELGLPETTASGSGAGFSLDDQAMFAEAQMAASYGGGRRGLGCGSGGADDDDDNGRHSSMMGSMASRFTGAATSAAAGLPSSAKPDKGVKGSKGAKANKGSNAAKVDFQWKQAIRRSLKKAPGRELKVKELRAAVLAEYTTAAGGSFDKKELQRQFKKRLKKASGIARTGKIVRMTD